MAKTKGDSNLMGALTYLFGWMTGIILYFVKKDDPFVKFHAVQSIIVFGGFTVLSFVLTITLVGILLLPILGIASLVLWLLLMWKAYQGEMYKLPMVGDWAAKYAK